MAGDSSVTLTPNTRVTFGFLALFGGAVAWIFSLATKVEAQGERIASIEMAQIELQKQILQRMDQQTERLSQVGVDLAGISAQVRLLVEWSDTPQRSKHQ